MRWLRAKSASLKLGRGQVKFAATGPSPLPPMPWQVEQLCCAPKISAPREILTRAGGWPRSGGEVGVTVGSAEVLTMRGSPANPPQPESVINRMQPRTKPAHQLKRGPLRVNQLLVVIHPFILNGTLCTRCWHDRLGSFGCFAIDLLKNLDATLHKRFSLAAVIFFTHEFRLEIKIEVAYGPQ